jgi:hypothetical protein
MKKLRLYKLGFLGLAAFYILISCGADLFHTERCPLVQSHYGVSSEDVCPACMLKNSANSTEPLYTNLALLAEMAWMNMVTHPAIMLSNEPASQLSIRAPPSNISC